MDEAKGSGALLFQSVRQYWEGREVWVVLDPKEGLWRQAQCVCVIPSEQDQPSGKWSFVVDTRHDSFRHVLTLTPTDAEVTRFDHLKLADAALLSSGDHVFKGWQSPAWFDIQSIKSVNYNIKDGSVALHPYVSEEIIELRKLCQQLKAQVNALEHTVQIKTEENAEQAIEIVRLKDLLFSERQRFRAFQQDLEEKLEFKVRECNVLQETNDALVRELDELKHLVNQAQADNNVLRSRLQLMLEEMVKLKTLITNLQLELSEKKRQVAALTKENEDIKALLQAAYDRNLELEEKLRALELEHYKLVQEHSQCEIIKRSLQEELERLRRRPLPQTVPVPVPTATEHDDSALLALLAQYEAQYENVWRIIYETLLALSDRVALLENRLDWPQGKVAVMEEPVAKGEEGVSEAKKMASQMGGEVNTLAKRIEDLELFLNNQPPPPPPVVIPKLDKSPDLDSDLLRQLISLVKYLTLRQEDLFAKVDKFKPEYVATYKQLVTSAIRKTQYDGDFPWLITKKLHSLEQENKVLRDQHEITKSQHYELVNRTDMAFQPIIKENSELRGKIDRYRDDLVNVYKRLSDAEDALKKASAMGFLDSSVLKLTGVEVATGL